MKKIDCPLCGAKDVIIYTEPELVTNVTPYRSKEDVIVGGYTRDWEGGGYDWSHADICPELIKAFNKKGLLQYYVLGEPEATQEDQHTFDQYNEALSSLGVPVGIEISRKNGQWECSMYAYSSFASIRSIETTAGTPDLAFNLFRHRILCGEPIRHYYDGKDISYQIKKGSSKLEFVTLEGW